LIRSAAAGGGILIFITKIDPDTFEAEISLSPSGDDHGPHHSLTLVVSRKNLEDLASAVEQTILDFPEPAAGDLAHANHMRKLPVWPR
jgi:hypothetical protein